MTTVKDFRTRPVFKDGLQIPAGAGAGLLAVSDASGNLSWSNVDMATQAELDAVAATAAAATATHAALTTGAHGGIVASSDTRLTDVRNLNFQAGTHTARLAATATNGKVWKETDTGLLYIGNGATWDIFKADGQVLKTADETVNNSASAQDDDHLFFPIEANEQWFVEAFLFCNAPSVNSDFNLRFIGPSGATGMGRQLVSGAWVTLSSAGTPLAVVGLNSGVNVGGLVGTIPVQLNWYVTAASTAGTVKLQWSQNTQTVEDNKVLAGSFLRLRRLA